MVGRETVELRLHRPCGNALGEEQHDLGPLDESRGQGLRAGDLLEVIALCVGQMNRLSTAARATLPVSGSIVSGAGGWHGAARDRVPRRPARPGRREGLPRGHDRGAAARVGSARPGVGRAGARCRGGPPRRRGCGVCPTWSRPGGRASWTRRRRWGCSAREGGSLARRRRCTAPRRPRWFSALDAVRALVTPGERVDQVLARVPTTFLF